MSTRSLCPWLRWGRAISDRPGPRQLPRVLGTHSLGAPPGASSERPRRRVASASRRYHHHELHEWCFVHPRCVALGELLVPTYRILMTTESERPGSRSVSTCRLDDTPKGRSWSSGDAAATGPVGRSTRAQNMRPRRSTTFSTTLSATVLPTGEWLSPCRDELFHEDHRRRLRLPRRRARRVDGRAGSRRRGHRRRRAQGRLPLPGGGAVLRTRVRGTAGHLTGLRAAALQHRHRRGSRLPGVLHLRRDAAEAR